MSDEERARLIDQADALRADLARCERCVRFKRRRRTPLTKSIYLSTFCSDVYEVYDEDDEIADYMLEFVKFARAKANPAAKFTTMSNDVLHLVLRRFKTLVGVKQLVAISTVNKQMRDAVRNPMVWQTVDLSAYKTSLTDKVLYSLVQDDDAFTCVKKLRLRDCSRLTDRSVLKVLRKCCKTVEFIDLGGCERLTQETLSFIMHECKELTALNIAGCSGMPAKFFYDNFFALPENLVKIRIDGVRGLHGRVDEDDVLALAESVRAFTAEYESRLRGDAARINDWEARFNAPYASDVLLNAEFIKDVSSHVARWKRGESAACDHAHSIQHVGTRRSDPILTLFPDCGHVSCVDCALSERRHMRVVDGEYIYPCVMCHEPMPAPGGFEVVVRSDGIRPRNE